MKTAIVKSKKHFLILYAALCMLFVTGNSFAYNRQPDTSSKEVRVEYLGTKYDQPLFRFTVQNEANEELVISIENGNGETLYMEKSNEAIFSKKIQFATTETNINLSLRVYSRVTKQTQVYEINKFTRVDDALVINQVKY